MIVSSAASPWKEGSGWARLALIAEAWERGAKTSLPYTDGRPMGKSRVPRPSSLSQKTRQRNVKMNRFRPPEKPLGEGKQTEMTSNGAIAGRFMLIKGHVMIQLSAAARTILEEEASVSPHLDGDRIKETILDA